MKLRFITLAILMMASFQSFSQNDCIQSNDFSMGNTGGWFVLPNGSGTIMNPAVGGSESPFYRARDGSTSEWLLNNVEYSGNLNCKQLCFDFRIDQDGIGFNEFVSPRFVVYAGTDPDPEFATFSAITNLPVSINENSGWVHVCLTFKSSSFDGWTMVNGNPSNWPSLLQNASGIGISTDWVVNAVEVIDIDNVCLVDLEELEAVPDFHLENSDGVEKTVFCFGEEVFLDGLDTENETGHYVSISVNDQNGNLQKYSKTGNIYTPIEDLINLSALLASDDNDPFDPNNEHLIFRPGFIYSVKLAVWNDCNDESNWEEQIVVFTVTCDYDAGCDAYRPDPHFFLQPTDFDTDHYTLVAVDHENYNEIEAVHEWFMFTSPNQTGIPATPVTVVVGDDFSYEPAAYGIFNFVIHRITTDCGVYCHITYNNNGGHPTNPGLDPPADIACDMIDEIFNPCGPLTEPMNLMATGGILSWDPVPGATEYIVTGQIGGQTSCNCGGSFPIQFPIGTTSTNSIPVPDFAISRCFTWTVTAVCADGTTSSSASGCHFPDFGGGGRTGGGDDGGRRFQNNDISNKALTLYPNPTSDRLYFTLSDLQLSEQGFQVQIINTAGQVVRSEQIAEGSYRGELNVAQLPNGYYMVHFLGQEGQSYFKKVIINK